MTSLVSVKSAGGLLHLVAPPCINPTARPVPTYLPTTWVLFTGDLVRHKDAEAEVGVATYRPPSSLLRQSTILLAIALLIFT